MVRVEYDQKADAMYIWLRKAKYDISEELAENVIKELGKRTRHQNLKHRENSRNSLNYQKSF